MPECSRFSSKRNIVEIQLSIAIDRGCRDMLGDARAGTAVGLEVDRRW